MAIELLCDGCGQPITDRYGSFGGNWSPFVPAKCYHMDCLPTIQPPQPSIGSVTVDGERFAPTRTITPEQLYEMEYAAANELFKYTPPSFRELGEAKQRHWVEFASRINAFFSGQDEPDFVSRDQAQFHAEQRTTETLKEALRETLRAADDVKDKAVRMIRIGDTVL